MKNKFKSNCNQFYEQAKCGVEGLVKKIKNGTGWISVSSVAAV